MKSFEQIYEEVYNEYNNELEDIKKSVIKKSNMRYISIFFIAVICSILVYIINSKIISILLNENVSIITISIAIVILTLVFRTISEKEKEEYSLAFKSRVVSKFIKSYSANLEFFPEKGISANIFNEAEFENYYGYHSEDYISGTLDIGYKIQMAEVHTVTGDSTIFYGLFAQVEHEKLINQTIKVRRNSVMEFSNRKEKVEMDSEEFEAIYDVYSQDKITTIQLLTADVMQMFIDFKRQYKHTPELTLKGNKLYIRFYTGNVFESNTLEETLDYNILMKYYDIINFTLEITENILKNIKETEI